MRKASIFLSLGAAACLAAAARTGRQPVDWVNPFIGTTNPGLRWMLFPGVSMPFGMVKLSPDNREQNRRGGFHSGYDYNIGTIAGFSHIHEWTMGGLLMMPATGPLKVVRGPEAGSPEGFRSRFRHETEQASPGYYAVTLDDYNVRAELTSTTRAGFQRYTFPKSDQARVLMAMDLSNEYNVVVADARIRKVSNTEIEGYCDYTGRLAWLHYRLHFVVRFSKPFDAMGGWVGSNIVPDGSEIAGNGDVGAFASYHTSQGEAIEVKTGISLVSVEQARLNLDTEMNRFGWDFDAVHKKARDTWNHLLSRIEVEGGTETDRIKFYTNLYHSYVARTIWSDVNGKYVDPLGRVQQLKDPASPMYGCDAFWNLFWNLNQLWTLVTPDIANQWVKSELELNDRGGWLPRGPAGLRYTGIMVAEHEISTIVSAWQKGIRNFDAEKAFQAIKHVQTMPGMLYKEAGGAEVGNAHLESYLQLGYVPVEEGQVSLTLEYSYDDWCAAQLAKALGKTADYEYFLKRSRSYRNVWDPAVGYFRPRHRDGNWLEDFSPMDRRNYTEGNAWQYAWWVPHDMKSLIELMGKDEFVRRLNEGFENSRPNFSTRYIDMGNQPNMQSPWLFNYAGAPWLTEKWVREVMESSYRNEPQGYVGDEDQGQMAAWYAMSAMGIFEMDGGCSQKPIYEIGSPVFSRIVIHLDKKYYPGRQFVIEAKNDSPKNVYIQSATLNGKRLDAPWIYHSAAVKGGALVLVMGPEPNKDWGSAPAAAPPQNEP
jgi:predicted alpha-1,2-mannosidase